MAPLRTPCHTPATTRTSPKPRLGTARLCCSGFCASDLRRGEYRCPLPTGFVYDEAATSCSTLTHRSGKGSPTFSKRSHAWARQARR